MKATGIVLRIDNLGRVVIPKEIRRVIRISHDLEEYMESRRTFIHCAALLFLFFYRKTVCALL